MKNGINKFLAEISIVFLYKVVLNQEQFQCVDVVFCLFKIVPHACGFNWM
jgi:hypothetical protein